MRELKFRVWSEEDKEYRTDLNVFRLVEGKIFCTSPSYSLEGDRFDIEQYTGFKDKNGKEIYEGDVVETPIYGVWTTGDSDAIFGEKMWKLVVFWSDADCGFLFKVIGSKNQPNRVYDVLDQHLGAFKVIGNIYENPELLEGNE